MRLYPGVWRGINCSPSSYNLRNGENSILMITRRTQVRNVYAAIGVMIVDQI